MNSKGIQFLERTNVENQLKIKNFLTKINERKLEHIIADNSTEPVSHESCQFDRNYSKKMKWNIRQEIQNRTSLPDIG